MKTDANNLVAIVGRPNVGKSALFNRLVGRPIAIVEDRPGVTRDRHSALVEWGGRRFWAVDTAGYETGEAGVLPRESLPRNRPRVEWEKAAGAALKKSMQEQVLAAMQEASQILFVVDGKAGLQPADEWLARFLRRTEKPVHLVVNKIDTGRDEDRVWEFAGLGFDGPLGASSLHGRAVDALLDRVCAAIPPQVREEEAEEDLRVAVVGRPNVGKSTLVNRLLGREASVVFEAPGTTRDSVDSPFRHKGKPYILVDTAGLRHRGRITDAVEKYASMRAIRSIENCDVAVLVLDAKEGVTEQDERVAGLIHEAGRGCVVAVNKWDLVEKDNKTFNAYLEAIRARLPFLDYAPIVFISALTRQRLANLMDLVDHAGEQHAMRISTGMLNRELEAILTEAPPPTRHGKALKIFYLSQTGVKPPAFALFVNDPKLLHFSYMRHLKNKLRSKFGFEGSPIIVMLRRRK